ncbi:hypothetical protein [Desulfotomaculum copahuensis]|uniref:Glycosyltransferase 2-like domain-containing protein n=1 Tax=Desulfotomaculum copahuensis TaxID=1838280 RepID=A0A1B7LBT3_9FIRM|nr:hypothetical protein [Desulfotomaculum copahuensis]OAT80193.1 hypothetical protein A6M21_00835 [Desulfotomaculum copahuensis]
MLAVMFLALLLGWYVCAVVKVLRLYSACLRGGEHPRVKLVVMVGGQDSAVEGFLRRLAARRNAFWPRLEILVVVDGHRDDATLSIARILGREAALPALTAEQTPAGLRPAVAAMCGRLPGEPRDGRTGGVRPVWYYDARGLQGRGLLRAPVFSQLGWI